MVSSDVIPWEKWETYEKPNLQDSAMIVALSTAIPQYVALYSQARELADYLKNRLDSKVLARYYSASMPAACLIREDGVASLYECTFHLLDSGNGSKIVLLSGDSAPFNFIHEFTESILSFAKGIGVTELFSIGPRWADSPVTDGNFEALGFAGDTEGVERLEKNGVKIIREEEGPYFSNLVVGTSGRYNIRGYKLSVNHGEPRPHPISVKSLLQVLSGLTRLKVDTTELDEKAKKMASAKPDLGATVSRPKSSAGEAIYG